jgi:carbamoyl-phosphate synthase large subunit
MSGQEKSAVEEYSRRIAKSLGTVGLLNIQYAVKNGTVYILEANPRASRTVPFVSKAVGVPLVKLATRAMLGEKLKDMNPVAACSAVAVKSVVFPFLKLSGTDIGLGPEMRSTGETMGIGKSFELAYYKALLAAGFTIKGEKRLAFLSLCEDDKIHVPALAGLLNELDFSICGTKGTVESIEAATIVAKIGKGDPDVLETFSKGDVSLVINTPRKGGMSHTDGFKIRRAAIEKGIPCITNISTAFELLRALKTLKEQELELRTVDEWTN